MCNTLSAIGVGARWLLHEHHLECTSWQAEALISSYNYESTQHIYIWISNICPSWSQKFGLTSRSDIHVHVYLPTLPLALYSDLYAYTSWAETSTSNLLALDAFIESQSQILIDPSLFDVLVAPMHTRRLGSRWWGGCERLRLYLIYITHLLFLEEVVFRSLNPSSHVSV